MPKPGNEPSTWNEFPVFNEQMEFACTEQFGPGALSDVRGAVKGTEAGASACQNWRTGTPVRIPPSIQMAQAILPPAAIHGGEAFAPPPGWLMKGGIWVSTMQANWKRLYSCRRVVRREPFAMDACMPDRSRRGSRGPLEHFEAEYLVRSLGTERILTRGELFIHLESVEVI